MIGWLGRLIAVGGELVMGMRLWARGRSRAPGVLVRVAAVFAPIPGPADPATVLTAYEALVLQAAAAGARLVVLPSGLATLDDVNYPLWMAQVRHWARQSQTWIVLGYTLAGTDPGGRLIAIDPSGNLHSGRDASASRMRGLGPVAQFSAQLSLMGWRRRLIDGRGVLALPTALHRTGRLAALIGGLTGAAVVCAGREGVWISTSDGRWRSGHSAGGAQVMVADLMVAEGCAGLVSNPTP